jgi:peptidoglycan hydrolase-like protein with peptidoglycan-binding domain
MNAFRLAVSPILGGTAPAPVLIPAVEAPARADGSTGRPTLRRPSIGEQVKQVQAKVGVVVDGNFGPKTETAVRAFQRDHSLVPTVVGPKTWAALDGVPAPIREKRYDAILNG